MRSSRRTSTSEQRTIRGTTGTAPRRKGLLPMPRFPPVVAFWTRALVPASPRSRPLSELARAAVSLASTFPPGMLDRAHAAIESAGVTNVELLQADACDLPQFQSASFDIVVCAAALLYMPVQRALAEWYRLLKPGGTVGVSTMRAGFPQAGQLFRDCAAELCVRLNDPSADWEARLPRGAY
jgi:SAM-dependent methyltransferase